MNTLQTVSGVASTKRLIPTPLALTIAWLSETFARLTGGTTLLTVSGVKTILNPHALSSAKAVRDLGATFRPLEDTLRDTVNWYRQQTAKPLSTRGMPIKN
jgi:dihydroflavonol-4-reductase